MLPPQARHSTHEGEQPVHDLIVLQGLRGVVGLRVRRTRVRHFGRRLTPDFVGFRDAQAPLTGVGFRSNAHRRTLQIEGAVARSLLFEQGCGVAQVGDMPLYGRGHVLDGERPCTFAGEAKAFQHRFPTAGEEQVLAVVPMLHTEQEGGALGQTVLEEGPPFRRPVCEDAFFRVDRWSRDVP